MHRWFELYDSKCLSDDVLFNSLNRFFICCTSCCTFSFWSIVSLSQCHLIWVNEGKGHCSRYERSSSTFHYRYSIEFKLVFPLLCHIVLIRHTRAFSNLEVHIYPGNIILLSTFLEKALVIFSNYCETSL